MKLPRWLTPDVIDGLNRVDQVYQDQRRNAPLVIEIHHRGGKPQIVRLRDVLMAPVMMELSLSFMQASTS